MRSDRNTIGRSARVLGLAVCVGLLGLPAGAPLQAHAAGSLVASARDGKWSDPSTWAGGTVPGPGAAVRISKGTAVLYDVLSDRELSSVEIEGTLEFSRERSTRMDSGNILIRGGGVLTMGTEGRPIPPHLRAEIRLVVPEGATFAGGHFSPGDIGVWVFPGGRWEVHGAPLRHTWAKLARPARAGEVTVTVRGDVTDWPRGADVVLTPTGAAPLDADFEERRVEGVTLDAGGLTRVRLSVPLRRDHEGGGEFSGEIALLSRNARIVSKYPGRTQAHTMFMEGARGGISYAEFQSLGTLGVLGRYPIHFHMMGDGSRGMSVRGAAIWRSDNHFLNIHASNGVTVEDTVGYDVAGSGFFLERAEEIRGAQERTGGAEGTPRVKQRPARQGQKGEDIPNLDTRFVHNLAVKGIWRPGSLDDPHRVSLFWISSLHSVLIDNVAVGARGGRDSSGFHFAEGSRWSRTATPLTMLRNEAHSNAGHGLFSWINAGLDFHLIGFRAWRNGKSGMALGAYNGRYRIYNADLAENGAQNISAWIGRTWIQDSTLKRSGIGLLFNHHFVATDPEDPALIVNTRFQEHRDADVSQDHQPCGRGQGKQSGGARGCLANYAIFVRPSFLSSRPLDFGWHAGPDSWMEIVDWPSPPPGLPSSFRVVRRDQSAEAGALVAAVDGRVRPVRRSWDHPPSVAIEGGGSSTGVVAVRARAEDDRGVAAVEFFADAVMIGRATAPPYTLSWRPAGGRRPAYVYARAIDTGGNLAYSQILRLAPPAP